MKHVIISMPCKYNICDIYMICDINHTSGKCMIIKVDNHVLLILHVNLAAVCRYVMHCKCRSEEFVIPDPISSLSHSNFIYHVVLDLKKKNLKIISLQSALFNDLLKFAIQYINKKITTLFLFFFLLF